jgi:hypothetical protein
MLHIIAIWLIEIREVKLWDKADFVGALCGLQVC